MTKPAYWRIPRSEREGVDRIVSLGGYHLNLEPGQGTSGDTVKMRITGSDGMTLAFVDSVGEGLGRVYQTPTIKYNTQNTAQVREALRFRRLLEENQMPYMEDPVRNVAEAQLRKLSDEFGELAGAINQ